MASILTVVFLIFLQFSSQNIGCYAEKERECHSGQKSNLWDTIKEVVFKASDILKYGIKIVGHVLNALGMMCTCLKSFYGFGKAFVNIMHETLYGASKCELLKYGFETAVLTGVTIKGILFSLSLFGFGPVGITAGSIAAWIQSVWFSGTIGGITGWLFSALQSVGVVGLVTAGMAVIVTFTSGIVASLYEYLF